RWTWAACINTVNVGTPGVAGSATFCGDGGTIDRCITEKAVATIYLHGIGAGGGMNNLTVAAWETLIDDVYDNMIAGDLEPIFTEDLYL
ncbi:MAG TPA: hypothetical protein VMW52_07570, partial [Phycisphaerae bacterium]|nr:hypothetical protein [Phycisphaerae bacterium]